MALSHLLQLRFCRLRFPLMVSRQCGSLSSNGGTDGATQQTKDVGDEGAQITIDEPLVKEEPKNDQMVTDVKNERATLSISSETLVKKESVAYSCSGQAKRLTDIFHKQYEEINYTQKLSDAILSCAKFMNPESLNIMSRFTNLLHGEQKKGPRDDELEEFPKVECEPNSSAHKSQMHEEIESSSPSYSSNNESDSEELSIEPIIGQAENDIAKPKTTVSSFQSVEREGKSCGTDTDNHSEMRGLIDVVRPHENVPPETANDLCNCREDTSIADSGRSDIDDERDFLIEDQETTSEYSSDLISIVQASSYLSSKNRKQVEEVVGVREESKKNKVTVWFMNSSSTTSDVEQVFRPWGEISKVDFTNCHGPLFKAAHVYFKGKAVDKGAKQLTNSTIVIKSDTSSLPHVIPPRLLGDPLAPSALVKFPTRTVKVKRLSREITTGHLEEAFAFCESRVSGCFFGSKHSAAYVEFETELGKEKALAKQSINVKGKNLNIFRVDSPRTTVVRICYNSEKGWARRRRIMDTESIDQQTLQLCRSLGKVRSCMHRSGGIFDVNFALDEWPNMLSILNRLNGFELEGRILKAEPAALFPPDVLLALWRDQEGRQHVEATVWSLLHKVMQVPDTSKLASIQQELLHRAFKA